jgi:integral membrane sensor domain MASE1
MVIRGIGGIVLVLLGAVWIAQGTGAMGGSSMSGHGQYAVLGLAVALIGAFLLVQGWRTRNRDSRRRR